MFDNGLVTKYAKDEQDSMYVSTVSFIKMRFWIVINKREKRQSERPQMASGTDGWYWEPSKTKLSDIQVKYDLTWTHIATHVKVTFLNQILRWPRLTLAWPLKIPPRIKIKPWQFKYRWKGTRSTWLMLTNVRGWSLVLSSLVRFTGRGA